MEFQGRREEKAKAEIREAKDPEVEKEGKYNSWFCFDHFAPAATLLSLKTLKSCGQVMGKMEWETSKDTFSEGSLENGKYKKPGTAPKPI